MDFFSIEVDSVVGGFVVAANSTYEEALRDFYPLIRRLGIQRDPIRARFYTRLEEDIVRGCVIPPVTIALVNDFGDQMPVGDVVWRWVCENLGEAFVLDGIQRLSALHRASEKEGFDARRHLSVNFIIAKSRDRLLYRMITLNNGQKPMSARHQIEILADAFFDFEGVELNLLSEKGGSRVRAPSAFKKADFVKGYIAYLSDSINIDNQKIIEEKMDELIAAKIIESDIASRGSEFGDVVDCINRLSGDDYLRDWLRLENNFIGFCVGARDGLSALAVTGLEQVRSSIQRFESAFSSVKVSKVKLGRARRDAVSRYIASFSEISEMDEFDLLDRISGWL